MYIHHEIHDCRQWKYVQMFKCSQIKWHLSAPMQSSSVGVVTDPVWDFRVAAAYVYTTDVKKIQQRNNCEYPKNHHQCVTQRASSSGPSGKLEFHEIHKNLLWPGQLTSSVYYQVVQIHVLIVQHQGQGRVQGKEFEWNANQPDCSHSLASCPEQVTGTGIYFFFYLFF